MAENSGSVSCGSITGTGTTFSENWLRANREKSRKGTKDTLGAEHILFSAIYFECGILLSSSSLMDVQKKQDMEVNLLTVRLQSYLFH